MNNYIFKFTTSSNRKKRKENEIHFMFSSLNYATN